ncbi:class C sortase [Gemelliphila palaticanis]|uniref:Class C sortase n=1 Tax=Gemelliphila palaticanis TaxID=81950 RepID=A0ABX2SYN8_9BACL|nr:class C sortase [Gemella palaticanis]MBF0715203.1 class C sortase [Gemella palaticanis]NYS47133.1 class C sortase [Gemella palaticanis]
MRTKRVNRLKRTNKKNKKVYPYVLLFLFGILIFSYPFISQYYYDIESNKIIVNFSEEANKIKREELDRKLELAKAYNSTLNPLKLADPYTDNEEKGIAEYARMLEVKEMIGHVEIPKLSLDIPIYAGTSDEVLEKGSGHLEGSSLPIGGESSHTVLTAHRGLSSAVMFRNIDKLKEGDVFLIHNIFGTLAYKVDKIQVVKPTNFDPVLVVEGKDYATLLTCDPYLINSHRLLVRGYRIPYSENSINYEDSSFKNIYLMLIVIFILSVFLMLFRRKLKNGKNKQQ